MAPPSNENRSREPSAYWTSASTASNRPAAAIASRKRRRADGSRSVVRAAWKTTAREPQKTASCSQTAVSIGPSPLIRMPATIAANAHSAGPVSGGRAARARCAR